MTLEDLFQQIGENPAFIIFYFSILPLTALLAGFMGKDEGHISPWKYLYSSLIYLVSVPGIFAITLSIYFFLFERRSVMQTDIFNQVLPVISMVITLLIIQKNVQLERIPGFGKLSGLITMISAALIIMWFIDRTHIVVFSRVPILYLLGIFAALLFVIRFGWKKMFTADQPAT